ncbi:MAG: Zn-dependent oligopeptidase [Desulfobacterium sp.]|nr:Zn-dependent oligopeptidase [Desulfobacterium sp.]
MYLKKAAAIFCVFSVTVLVWGCRVWDGSDNPPASTLSYVTFPTTVDGVDTQLKTSTAALRQKIDDILAQDIYTFENTVHALNDALYDNSKTMNRHFSAFNLAPLTAVRNASSSAYLENEAAQRRVFYNNDLYQAINQVAETHSALTPTEKRLVDLFLKKFEENGIHLSEWDREALDAITTEIGSLESEFQKNVTNENTRVVFTPEALQGVPESDLAMFANTPDGNYEMDPRQLSHLQSVTTYAEDEATRQRAYIAFYSVAKEKNPAILERIIQLRAQKAALLNYDSHGDLKTSTRMAKTSETAMAFLEQLSSGISTKLAGEKATLLSLKKTDTNNPDAMLNLWDLSFYQNRYDRDHFQLNHDDMKKYFSLSRCIEGMFDTFESVFGINIVKGEGGTDPVWHDDVQLYEVRDAATRKPLGSFYLDLYPREGKYTHFATDFTCNGNTYENGDDELPTGILIGNWAKPTAEKPSLLSFYELTTLFHEFGHTLHLILMNTTYSFLHVGSWDFMEVPSQMAEQWCFDQGVLDRFAVNYQDPSDRLPADYAEKIKRAENAFSAIPTATQIASAMTDLTLHTAFQYTDDVDVNAVYKNMAETYSSKRPDETSAISRLTHLVGGYDAGYYTYQWSLAIVHDLKTVFNQTPGGLMDPAPGAMLKQEIFEPGSTRDEDESVRLFLGRDWDADAYIHYLTASPQD